MKCSNLCSQTVLGFVVSFFQIGCGDDASQATSSNSETGGRSAAPQGGSTLARGGGSRFDESGGGTQSAAGGTSGRSTSVASGGSAFGTGQGGGTVAIGAGAGGRGDAGATSTGAAGIGNSDTSNCAIWPQSKVFPYPGLSFFGPDPGPCSNTRTTSSGTVLATTYTYANLHIVEAASSTQTTTFTWNGDVLAGSVITTPTGSKSISQYTWTDNSLTEVTGNVTQVVHLGPAGYPLDSWTITATSNYKSAQYEYSDCRLIRRIAYSDSGAADVRYSANYEYDAVGHISLERLGNGTTTAFDYGCW